MRPKLDPFTHPWWASESQPGEAEAVLRLKVGESVRTTVDREKLREARTYVGTNVAMKHRKTGEVRGFKLVSLSEGEAPTFLVTRIATCAKCGSIHQT